MSAAFLTDPGLPGLAAALDPATASACLSGLGSLRADVRVRAVEVLKHKPGRRCSLAFDLGQDGMAFGKVFANDRGAQIASTMARVADALVPSGIVVPRPHGWHAPTKLLVTEFVEGTPLAAELYAGGPGGAARRMAEAAAALHASGVRCARRWSVDKELRNTESWIRGLSGRGATLDSRAKEAMEALRAVGGRLGEGEIRVVHRDYYPDQVWDARGRTGLLDLDDVRAGDPAVDVGNFLAHLTLRPLQFPATADGCAAARGAFVGAYVALGPVPDAGDPAWVRRVGFYEASTLLRLAGVYAARSRWLHEIPDILVAAATRRVATLDLTPEGL